MKKLIFLSVVLFVTTTVMAQNKAEIALKKEIKVLKKEGSTAEPMVKKDRKELRKLEGADVSYQAKQRFTSDFGNIPVSQWIRVENYDEATFTKDGKVMHAFYDADSKLVGTTSPRTFADLPVDAQKYINKKYGDYTKEQVLLFDDNEFNETDMLLYGMQFDDEDNYFLELEKDNKESVLKIDMEGMVSFFKQID